MKKVILVGIMFMMFMGVVSASSFNGDYKGNPIVKIFSEGNEIRPDDVPALIYNGRTVVPISLLKKLGVDVVWNQKDYSVNIAMPTPRPTSVPELNLFQTSKDMKKHGVTLINYMTDGEGIDKITYYTNFSSDEGLTKAADYNAILDSGLHSGATLLEVYYTDKFAITMPSSALRDFKSGKITEEKLKTYYEFDFTDYKGSAQPTATPSGTDTTNQQSNATGTQTTQATATSTPKLDNSAQCKNLRDNYTLAKSQLNRTVNPFSGKASYEEKLFEYTWSQTFAAAGC